MSRHETPRIARHPCSSPRPPASPEGAERTSLRATPCDVRRRPRNDLLRPATAWTGFTAIADTGLRIERLAALRRERNGSRTHGAAESLRTAAAADPARVSGA